MLQLVDKESGICGSSSHEVGSSWAVEVGNNQKVCPMRVENIGMSGQMLVEVRKDNFDWEFWCLLILVRLFGETIRDETSLCDSNADLRRRKPFP